MRLFVYGIFLSTTRRQDFGLQEIGYTTIPDYATVGRVIVEAVPCEGYALTGLAVYVPDERVPKLDRLEAGYRRIKVRDHYGDELFMYASLDAPGENFNSWNKDRWP